MEYLWVGFPGPCHRP